MKNLYKHFFFFIFALLFYRDHMAKSQYIIQFGGLSLGEHEFELDIKDRFFEQYEESEITKADVHVELILLKQNNLLQMEFYISGTVNTNCDRCLREVDYPIEAHEKLVLKHGDPAESTDEILVLKEGTEEADISQYLYEYIATALPGRRVPCEDFGKDEFECDYETLNKLEENQTKEETNPAWDKLKNINFNNN